MKKLVFIPAIIACLSFQLQAQTTIAVLPYSVNYQGNIPKKFTQEQLDEARRKESESYQASMINSLSRKMQKRAYRNFDLSVLSVSQTEALLAKNNLATAALDTLSNEQLVTILGVSHVVRGNVERTFIMSDELSLGITAIGVVTGNSPGMMNTTSMLQVINAIEMVPANEIVYSRQFMRRTTAMKSDEQSLRDTFRKSSRHMLKRITR